MLQFSNNAQSTLLTAMVVGATTVVVQVADAEDFVALDAADDYFMLTLEDTTQSPTVREYVRVTARVGNVLTVIRGQEGTVAAAFPVGATASNRITAGSLNALAQGAGSTTALYLGAFPVAPTTNDAGGSLVAGLLYFNTTTNQMNEFSGVAWGPLAGGSGSTSGGLYIGSFPVAPTSRPDGTILQPGDLYYSTSVPGLFEYLQGAWTPALGETTITGSTTVGGNLTVDGNLTVVDNTTLQGDLSVTGTTTLTDLDSNDGTFQSLTVIDNCGVGSLDIGGLPVVTAADLSGTVGSQNWPNGNVEYWGQANINGAGTIIYPVPFPNETTNVQLQAIGSGDGSNLLVDASMTNSLQFGVRAFEPDGVTPTNVAFYWTAKGN